jgi:hexosaminidase
LAGNTGSLILSSDWAPIGGDAGILKFVLGNGSDLHLGSFQLAFTSLFPIVVQDDQLQGASLVKQVSNYHLIQPPNGVTLSPGSRWSFSVRLSGPLRHYTSAVKSAYVVLGDGKIVPVTAMPTTRNGESGTPRLDLPSPIRLPCSESPIALLPFPTSVHVDGARDPTSVLTLLEGFAEAEIAFHSVKDLAKRLFCGETPLLAQSGDISCVARRAAGMGQEDYRIDFSPNGLMVQASQQAGFFYAFVSLSQILRAARLDSSQFLFPLRGEIRDSPRFGWRGMLLDVARQVFRPADLSWMLDCLAWHKLNRLHLHLSDDEGWRLDIPGYPRLAELAGRRGHGLAIPPLLGSLAEPYGIVYSGAEIAELVRRPGQLSVAIVPEIDMPGHSYATLEALPELRDPVDLGIGRNFLNPAVPATYDYVRAVVAELARLFPSPWIHIGGDEVPADAWTGSPLAKRFMQDSAWRGPYQLQSFFLRRVQQIARANGRYIGAWEEAALGGGIEASDSYLVAWREVENGLDLAQRGYNVVLAPAQAYYLDMAQSDDWWDPGMDWAGIVPADKCYRYDPGGDWPNEVKPRLFGVQGCLWSENLHERSIFARVTIPRLAAIAESAWTASANKGPERFAAMYHLLPPAGIR